MPTPNKGEKKQDYINRCTSDLINKEGYKPDQARAICESKWEQNKKEKSTGSIILDTFQNTPCAIVPEKLEEINALLVERYTTTKLADIEAYREGRSGYRANDHYTLDNGIATIPIYGVMSKRMNMFSEFSGGTSTQLLRTHIQAAIEDPDVKGIFLDVDSPGGAVEGTKELADYVKEARDIKPIVAFTDGLIASAAYWVSSAASEIVGTDLSQAGSIGVAAVHNDYSRRNEEMGVKKTHIYSGKYKRLANSDEPLSEEGKSYIQDMLDTYYKIFVDDVASNRGASSEDTMKMAEGKIFIGAQARDIGLIDHIGTREVAMERLRSRIDSTRKADNNSASASFTVEVINLTSSQLSVSETHTEKEGGNKTMDLKELKANHPELVQQILEEAKSSSDQQFNSLKDRLDAIEDDNKMLKAENSKLKEKDILRSERELTATVDSIWTKKLTKSNIPSRRHDDLKAIVKADDYIKECVLDVAGFSAAIDEKIKDWEGSFTTTQSSVLGFGTASKEVDGEDIDLNDQDRDLTAEEDVIVKRNLKLAK
jgi:signal peptide peptidase SppA